MGKGTRLRAVPTDTAAASRRGLMCCHGAAVRSGCCAVLVRAGRVELVVFGQHEGMVFVGKTKSMRPMCTPIQFDRGAELLGIVFGQSGSEGRGRRDAE